MRRAVLKTALIATTLLATSCATVSGGSFCDIVDPIMQASPVAKVDDQQLVDAQDGSCDWDTPETLRQTDRLNAAWVELCDE